MLRSLKDIERYKVSASDGDIGEVENFLLDDECTVPGSSGEVVPS
jgi:hypothetical protein